MARKIGKELVARMKHFNDSLSAFAKCESDRPQPIDACDLHARESQRLQPDRTPEPPSTPGEGIRQAGCIVTRLRQTRANMIGTDDEQHYWDSQDAANEIERLRLAIRRLAEQDATLSACEGSVTVTMDATLTDLERTAIAAAADDYLYHQDPGGRAQHIERTLRGLLERTSPSGTRTAIRQI
jgi:hypothetical protein